MGGKGKGQRGRPCLTSWGKRGNESRGRGVGDGGSARRERRKLGRKGEVSEVCAWIGTHHEVAAEVVLSPLLVPLAHGLHLRDELSQDAGLLHPPAGLEPVPVLVFIFFVPRKSTTPKPRGYKTHNKTAGEREEVQ